MGDAFWAFSLEFYQAPGVAESCLELQDRDGADVNLVLLALWAASRGHRLDAAMMAEAERAAQPWRQTVTQPIRAARKALKQTGADFDAAAVAALRRQVQAVELEAERLQQVAMARHCTAAVGRASSALARQNLRAYQAVHGGSFEPRPIQTLLQAFAARFD